MDCIFDSCQLINGLWLGIISSTIVAFVTYLIVNQKAKKDLRKKFGKAEGDYKGYGFEPINELDPKSEFKNILREKPISEATIRYLRDNILKITLEDNNGLTWEGEILMELETLGSVAWRYKNLKKDEGREQHRFGLKRLIIRDVNDEDFTVYLIGEKEEGYHKEVLIRN